MLSIGSIAGRRMATACCTRRSEYIILKIVQVSFVEVLTTTSASFVFFVQDSMENETIIIAVKIIAILEYFFGIIINIIKVDKIL